MNSWKSIIVSHEKVSITFHEVGGSRTKLTRPAIFQTKLLPFARLLDFLVVGNRADQQGGRDARSPNCLSGDFQHHAGAAARTRLVCGTGDRSPARGCGPIVSIKTKRRLRQTQNFRPGTETGNYQI